MAEGEVVEGVVGNEIEEGGVSRITQGLLGTFRTFSECYLL